MCWRVNNGNGISEELTPAVATCWQILGTPISKPLNLLILSKNHSTGERKFEL